MCYFSPCFQPVFFRPACWWTLPSPFPCGDRFQLVLVGAGDVSKITELLQACDNCRPKGAGQRLQPLLPMAGFGHWWGWPAAGGAGQPNSSHSCLSKGGTWVRIKTKSSPFFLTAGLQILLTGRSVLCYMGRQLDVLSAVVPCPSICSSLKRCFCCLVPLFFTSVPFFLPCCCFLFLSMLFRAVTCRLSSHPVGSLSLHITTLSLEKECFMWPVLGAAHKTSLQETPPFFKGTSKGSVTGVAAWWPPEGQAQQGGHMGCASLGRCGGSQPDTSTQELCKPSACSPGEENELHEHQEQREGEEVSPGAGGGKTWVTVIFTDAFRGHKKMFSHSRKGPSRKARYELTI